MTYEKAFEVAFAETMKSEGMYANVSGDSGGETIFGIARNCHPKWAGWVTLDKAKSIVGTTARAINAYLADNQEFLSLVKDFYYNEFWIKSDSKGDK
jgi:lysozyme family protein